MSAPSSRRFAARASSVSSVISTPTSRRRNSNTTSENNASNSPTPTRTLRRLQSRSKTVKWTQSINNDKSHDESSSDETSSDFQHQQRTAHNDESIMNRDNSDNEMTPAGIINSLSLSNTNNNNNNNSSNTTNNNNNSNNNNNNNTNNNEDDMTIDPNSPIVSDEEENDTQPHTNAVSTDPQIGNDAVKQAEILALFDESEDGLGYICKLCQTVKIYLDILSQ